jgi:glycosyltransferase involved in cell wall biosynthesis
VRIVALAYACEPGKGSEPGAGWAWARMLAGLGETWVITRANNRQAIEAALDQVPERDRLRFVYVDLPPWARSWKRGLRGVRLYYLLWQAAAVNRARSLHRALSFDLAWHLTLANAWLGSLGPFIGPPFIYGPVGGGTRPPLGLLPSLGARGIAYEALRELARFGGRYLNPLARVAWNRAILILAQNDDTRRWLPERHRSKATVFPNVVLEEIPSSPRAEPGEADHRVLFAARLLAWKGGSLAIQTIGLLPGWRLTIIGSGPDEDRLRRMAARTGLSDRVSFTPAIPREELLRRMQDAHVFLFPSLHDEAGWVVAEAASSGLSTVCLDVGGPALLGGTAVPPSTPGRTASALAGAVRSAATTRPSVVDFSLVARSDLLKDLLAARGLLAFPRRAGSPSGAAQEPTTIPFGHSGAPG